MTHHLKILPQWYTDVARMQKTFEIRKNDRDYKEGDIIIFHEWDGKKYTGRVAPRTIRYVYYGDGNYGLAEGYCVLGLGYYGIYAYDSISYKGSADDD